MHDMVGAWQRLSDNKYYASTSDMMKQICCVFHIWNLMKAEQRSGVLHKFEELIKHRCAKNLMVFCPACPEVGWNLEVGSEGIPYNMRQMQITGDGNFHINKQEKNTDPDDIALVGGRGIYPSCEDWETYLKEVVKPKGGGKKVPCNNHKAVTSQNAQFDNCEYTGVGQIQCSHVFVKATADFQKGEDQKTMDNALARALELAGLAQDGSECVDICFSYDINCQYCVHIAERFNARTLLLMEHHAVCAVKIIPLCHINGHNDKCNKDFNPIYLGSLCHFHGKTAEQFWAYSNGLRPMIHQMNLEHGHEIYFYQAMDWNYRKLMNMPNELFKDVVYAHKQFYTHESYFRRLTTSLLEDQVCEWQQQPCERPASEPKPKRGQKDTWLLVVKNKTYPNKTDEETIKCKQLSLQKAIKIWFQLRLKYMGPAEKGSPQVDVITALDTIQSKPKGKDQKQKKKKAKSESGIEDWLLGLPSAVPREAMEQRLGHKRADAIIEYKSSLQEGAAFDALHAVLLATDQLHSMGYDKSKNVKGYKPNTKAQEKMRRVKLHRNSGMVDWNAHHVALIVMDDEQWTRTGRQNTAKGFSGRGTKRRWYDDEVNDETANVRKKKKTAKKRGKKGDKVVLTEEPEDEDNDDEDNDKSGWIYELNEHGNINTADLQAWIYEGMSHHW
ncbi:uncharacterized protein ARMOST_06231 [Armillaria ostoyae]|uniref:CxC2-like cysteine cluster KDZ transposase-associated domain-containing protein n=1 Tax=Armillaria ostoyae TaxID=47428 RepID=A0A284R2F6_ARMOS|nr:uncharacterized protein ARMOST_06231 [Armillaria ostoyae]